MLPRKLFALDTNVPLDLASDSDAAWTLWEVCRERRYALRISPTVVQELSLIANTYRHPANGLAVKALSELRAWGIAPFDLKSVGHGITGRFAEQLIAAGLLPEGELNDGMILAETALAEIPCLVTSDGHLGGIEADVLTDALHGSGLSPVLVTSPKRLLKSLRPR